MTPSTPFFAPGQILAGKYRVERVLGQGGMGVVIAAQHIHLEERVAIKLMLDSAAFNQEAVSRFLREARAAARLESSHVAKVSDVGALEDGRPYMVMEYLDGWDLAQVLASSGPLPIETAVDYLLQASEAIAEAHSLGIVHRDLKPSNLFVMRRRDRSPHIKVLDFGISKVAQTSQSSRDNAMTKTSAMMGSPLYMSPEQMTSVKEVDGRSDIWALGIILFELLTGTPPFVGDTLPQVCGLVIQSEAPVPSSRRRDLPPEIDEVIRRCLAKNPNERYQSVAEFALALQHLTSRYGRASLERILVLSGGVAPPSRPPVASTPDLAVSYGSGTRGTHTAWGETKPPLPSRRSAAWVIVPLVTLLGLGGVAAGWFVLAPRLKPETSPAPLAASSASERPLVSATAVTAAPPLPPPPVATSAEAATPPPVASSPSPPVAAVIKAPARTPSTPKQTPSVAKLAPAPVAAPPVVAQPATPAPAPTPVKKSSSLGGRL